MGDTQSAMGYDPGPDPRWVDTHQWAGVVCPSPHGRYSLGDPMVLVPLVPPAPYHNLALARPWAGRTTAL